VLAGSFGELRKDGWRNRRAGAMFLHRAGVTHNDRFGQHGAVCLSLHLSPDDLPLGSMDGFCSTSTRLAADALAFELATTRPEDLVMGSLAAEMISEFWPAPTKASDQDSWIDKVVQAVSDEPVRRWTLRELANVAQRHPVHVAQGFRAKTGISLGAFQRRRRLVRLSLALRSGRNPLAVLASDFGYCDQSHMNAEFRAAFGVSPGRYRRELH
jgi:AraC family transcriptional regulator